MEKRATKGFKLEVVWRQIMMRKVLFLTALLKLRFEALFGQPFGFLNLIRSHTLRHMVPVFDDLCF